MILQDKLYKSSEVCDILGVSLRTLYRYIEDGKMGSVQLSSGRHRFTKDQIEKFLQLGPVNRSSVEPPIEEDKVSQIEQVGQVAQVSASEPKLSQQREQEEVIVETASPAVETFPMMGLGDEEDVKEERKVTSMPQYFRCPFDDLRVIAKLIKRAGENASADYAFTGPAGLSLFYPIKAFDKLHFYVSPDQMDFWKLRLQLENSRQDEANVVILTPDSVEVFDLAGERGGLKHVSVDRLKKDLSELDMVEELKEFESKGF
jgi:excisionase family DNA binding protein